MPSKKSLLVLLGLLTLGLCAVGFWKYHGYFSDDSFISLRYCHNFLNGEGLVWNPGERVEGYSNFLLVMLVSALGRLGIDLVTASQVVGVGAFVGLMLVLLRQFRRRIGCDYDDAYFALIPVILTAGSFCVIVWSVGGLESSLFAMLVTASLLLVNNPERRFPKQIAGGSALLGLATLARPDGGLFFVMAVLFYATQLFKRRENSGSRLLWLVLPYLIITGSHEIWRLAFYGQLVPNTWYVKGVFSWDRLWLGCLYLKDFALTPPYTPILIAIVMAYRAVKRSWGYSLSFLSSCVGAYLAYVAFLGGDHMAAFRPIVGIIPLMGILLSFGLRPTAQRIGGRAGLIAASVILLLSYMQIPLPGPGLRFAGQMDNAAYSGKIVGQYIEKEWPKGSLVALNSAGATPYYAIDHKFIDMLGLNDATIARREPVPIVSAYQLVPGHAKGDGQYVFARKPDYIIAGPSNGSDVYHAWTLSEYELARILEFKSAYRLKSVRIPVTQYDGYENHGDTKSGSMTFTYYERVK